MQHYDITSFSNNLKPLGNGMECFSCENTLKILKFVFFFLICTYYRPFEKGLNSN